MMCDKGVKSAEITYIRGLVSAPKTYQSEWRCRIDFLPL